MKEEIKVRWIDALLSGDYTPGAGALRSPEDKYCCLGVLCDLAAQDGVGRWVPRHYRPGKDSHAYLGRDGWQFESAGDPPVRGFLCRSVAEWAGLPYPEGPYLNSTIGVEVTVRGVPYTLSVLNDSETIGWSGIVDIIKDQL